jgi:hypothetical protein
MENNLNFKFERDKSMNQSWFEDLSKKVPEERTKCVDTDKKCYLRTNYGIKNIPILINNYKDKFNSKNPNSIKYGYYSYKMDLQHIELLNRYINDLSNILESKMCKEKCIDVKYDIVILYEAVAKTIHIAYNKLLRYMNIISLIPDKKMELENLKIEANNTNQLVNYYSINYVYHKLDYQITNLMNKNKTEGDYKKLIENRNKLKLLMDSNNFKLADKTNREVCNLIYTRELKGNVIESFNTKGKLDIKNKSNINSTIYIVLLMILIYMVCK